MGRVSSSLIFFTKEKTQKCGNSSVGRAHLAAKRKGFQPWQGEFTKRDIKAEKNAEIAQLVEHNLAAKRKGFQPWQGVYRMGYQRKNAEIAQLVEHTLPQKEKVSNLGKESTEWDINAKTRK